jgi:hypothetical protein
MSDKTRTTSTTVPKQASGRRPKGSYRKLGESAVPRLERAWARRGRETLARLSAERPVAYVRAMVRLVAFMHRRLPEPPGFDRQRARADVLLRVQELPTYEILPQPPPGLCPSRLPLSSLDIPV